MKHSLFCDDDEGLRRRVLAEGDHLLGRADLIGKKLHGLRALGMGHDDGIGVLALRPLNAITSVLHVNVAATLPEIHGPCGLLDHPGPKILIRDKENRAILRGSVDNSNGIAACADDIGKGLHSGAAVDVGDDEVVLISVFFQKGLQFVCRAGVGEGAPGLHIGDHDGLGGTQYLGGLPHEVDAAEDDDICAGLSRLDAQAEGIADKIGNLLDFLDLVVVGEDDGIPLFLQSENLCGKVGGMG